MSNIYLNFKTESQEIIHTATAANIENWLQSGHFWRGSMEPGV